MHLGVWRKLRVTIVLALTFSAENADSMLLSAMYLAIGTSLGIGPSKLGDLSMFRSLVTAVCVPFVGVIGNLYNRLILIAVGTIIWGAMSVGMGFAATYQEAAAWTAMNGLGLALVMPCAQSIMAEVFAAKERGRAFGALFTLSAFGGMICNFLAISFSRKEIGGHEGWRVIFFAVSGFAAVATAAVLLGGIEPRKYQPKQKEEVRPASGFWQAITGGLMLILRNTWQVFRIRSFQIILLASIIGTIAFSGIAGYRVMYFQLLGFSDVATATMSTVMTIGVAFGFIMGGAAGDWLFLRFPNASRPFINQLSMALAGPLAAVLFKAMPGCSRYATGVPGSLNHLVPVYCALEFFIGALGCFPVSNNAALFAEIVPESIRTSVYAFDRCITGAIGAAFTPLTGILAERLFGFVSRGSRPGAGAAAAPPAGGHLSASATAARYHDNVVNARALENGLVWVMLVPMVIKFFIYFGLYYTLPRDRIDEVDSAEGAAAALAADEEQAGGTGKSPGGARAKPKSPENGFLRVSPPIADDGAEDDEHGPVSPVKPGLAGSVTNLRRAPSGLQSRQSGGLREALAAQVAQSAQPRRGSMGLEAPARAGSLQRVGSGYVRRSGSMDALNRYISLELAQPPALSPRRPASKSNGK